MYKNIASQKVAVFAWDSVADAPKTGDAANITAQISKDGGACAASDDANPTELDATNAKGIYLFDLLQAETNCDLFVLSAVSSTENIVLDPVFIYTVVKTIEGSLTDEEIKRIILSALGGKSSGGGTTTIKFRDLADSKDRITATVDSNGNRTEVTLDGS